MRISCVHGHMGDCLWGLQLLRKAPGEHVFYCQEIYHNALQELIAGCPIVLAGASEAGGVRDCWIADGQFKGSHGISFANQVDIMDFVHRYLNTLGGALDCPDLLYARESMLCDWPSMESAAHLCPFDILIINATPGSHQCPDYRQEHMDALIGELRERGHSVIHTNTGNEKHFSLPEIGRLSQRARLIVGAATGPMWPALNIWNTQTPKIILLEPQRLHFEQPIQHAPHVSRVRELLKEGDWL